MIAFGSSVGEPEPYRRYAEPGIRRVAEADSAVYAFASVGAIGRVYNLLLDAAAAHEDLEALVLVHAHAEIDDPRFCAKIREALRDPDVAVVGCVGATGVRSIAWWEGSVISGPVTHRFVEHGGGEVPAYGWAPTTPAPGEADTVDGFLMVLSPWAVRNLRFDEGLPLGHGYDLDYCLQARVAGRRVTVADLRVTHHRSLEIVSDLDLWIESYLHVARKWDERMPGVEVERDDWRRRARRAEAEREAARAIAYSNALIGDARIERLQRELREMTDTASWRVTEPLRRANSWRAATAERRARRRP